MSLEYILVSAENVELGRVNISQKKKDFEKNFNNFMMKILSLGISGGKVSSLNSKSENVDIVGKEDLLIEGFSNGLLLKIKAILMNKKEILKLN